MANVNVANSQSFKIHGNSFEGQALTSGFDVYTITTSLDINPVGIENAEGTFDPTFNPLKDGTPTPNAAQRFNKLIELISTRAQPVVIGGITPGATAGTSVLNFTIEHSSAWEVNSLQTAGQNSIKPTLSDTINGVLDFVTGAAIGTNGVNTTVALNGQILNDMDPTNRPFSVE